MLDIATLVLRLATNAHVQRILVEIISSWIEMKTENNVLRHSRSKMSFLQSIFMSSTKLWKS